MTDLEKQLMWVAAIAVLKCPMSTADKIKTLEQAVNGLKLGFPKISPTGLAPFDAAISNYLVDLTYD
jgi:hypothetical protein